MIVDLDCEFAAAAPLSPADMETLHAAGIGAPTIAAGLVRAARIRVTGDLYEPDVDGRAAFLSPVRVDSPVSAESLDPVRTVQCGELIDIVAWHPRHPGRWALRMGAAECLGSVGPQYMEPPPVRLWRSPLAWLRADCDGLALLSRDLRSQFSALSYLHSVVAEDAEHAAELRRALAWPRSSPTVLLPPPQRKG